MARTIHYVYTPWKRCTQWVEKIITIELWPSDVKPIVGISDTLRVEQGEYLYVFSYSAPTPLQPMNNPNDLKY